MPLREPRPRPQPWSSYSQNIRNPLVKALHAIEYGWSWVAYYLGHWAFLEVLEYLGTFSILIAVIFYFSESGDRNKQKHYQAWQVINTAQGKGGSGGRIEALNELNADRVDLVGVDVSGAFLMGVRLDRAALSRANFEAADARYSSFRSADMTYGNFHSANLRNSDLHKANFENASLNDADLNGAILTEANLTMVDLSQADLRAADLRGLRWEKIKRIKLANVYGVKNAPAGFLEWAMRSGAVSIESDEAWYTKLPHSSNSVSGAAQFSNQKICNLSSDSGILAMMR